MSLSTGPVLLRSEAILSVLDINQNYTKKNSPQKEIGIQKKIKNPVKKS